MQSKIFYCSGQRLWEENPIFFFCQFFAITRVFYTSRLWQHLMRPRSNQDRYSGSDLVTDISSHPEKCMALHPGVQHHHVQLHISVQHPHVQSSAQEAVFFSLVNKRDKNSDLRAYILGRMLLTLVSGQVLPVSVMGAELSVLFMLVKYSYHKLYTNSLSY